MQHPCARRDWNRSAGIEDVVCMAMWQPGGGATTTSKVFTKCVRKLKCNTCCSSFKLLPTIVLQGSDVVSCWCFVTKYMHIYYNLRKTFLLSVSVCSALDPKVTVENVVLPTIWKWVHHLSCIRPSQSGWAPDSCLLDDETGGHFQFLHDASSITSN